LTPGQDLTDVPDKVAAICNTAWTPEVIEEYQKLTKEPQL
jgi:hypothetical protein